MQWTSASMPSPTRAPSTSGLSTASTTGKNSLRATTSMTHAWPMAPRRTFQFPKRRTFPSASTAPTVLMATRNSMGCDFPSPILPLFLQILLVAQDSKESSGFKKNEHPLTRPLGNTAGRLSRRLRLQLDCRLRLYLRVLDPRVTLNTPIVPERLTSRGLVKAMLQGPVRMRACAFGVWRGRRRRCNSVSNVFLAPPQHCPLGRRSRDHPGLLER